MSAVDAQIVREFWEVCNGVYEAWLGRRGLFEDNAELEQLGHTHCAQLLAHLGMVTQRDLLHQIAKLHDPARQFGQNNLSISFIIDNGLWDRETRMRLSMLRAKLDAFAELLRQARNKLTAHNDPATILAGRPLGQSYRRRCRVLQEPAGARGHRRWRAAALQ